MKAALVVIDMQQAIRDPRWLAAGPRNNHDAEANVGRLHAAWREAGALLVHVHHEGTDPGSTYLPDGPGAPFLPETAPLDGETIVTKRAHSAFVGTDLDATLRAQGVEAIVVCGVITNNSVEATVRHAHDLGWRVLLAEDACFTFAKRDRQGRAWAAEEVHALSLANLDGEYCDVVSTSSAIAALSA